jgi:hypothetical protein
MYTLRVLVLAICASLLLMCMGCAAPTPTPVPPTATPTDTPIPPTPTPVPSPTLDPVVAQRLCTYISETRAYIASNCFPRSHGSPFAYNTCEAKGQNAQASAKELAEAIPEESGNLLALIEDLNVYVTAAAAHEATCTEPPIVKLNVSPEVLAGACTKMLQQYKEKETEVLGHLNALQSKYPCSP